jgi:hypothetical protein
MDGMSAGDPLRTLQSVAKFDRFGAGRLTGDGPSTYDELRFRVVQTARRRANRSFGQQVNYRSNAVRGI